MGAFEVHLIKPTRYDEEGYPVQWFPSLIPSNSLACVAALVEDAKARDILGADVDVRWTAVDETNAPVFPETIIARHKTPDMRVFVMLVGVQTNQFPRAIDIARPLRAAGVPVCIGGFHVSGCVAMLGPEAEELAPARELGVSMFAGEAEEGRLDEVLRDGFHDRLKPLYNCIDALPSLSDAPPPMVSREVVERTYQRWSSFDLGRGCPFECPFCTIINVQGRKSRFRDVDDLERIVRDSREMGVWRFFVTDDDLARNRNWEAYADQLIELREKEGIRVRLIVQVDTLAHRIPNFIDKMYRAGAHIVFIGLESVNPDNLEIVKKRQNRIEEYREMILAWKRVGVIVICGYIVGFPNDSKASILRDIETIKHELPIDLISVHFLTPLPGSEDHKKSRAAGVWIDPDFNKYDLNRWVTHHPAMSDREWDDVFLAASSPASTWRASSIA
jgi:pyruvate-formate lyase-activating enzyme